MQVGRRAACGNEPGLYSLAAAARLAVEGQFEGVQGFERIIQRFRPWPMGARLMTATHTDEAACS